MGFVIAAVVYILIPFAHAQVQTSSSPVEIADKVKSDCSDSNCATKVRLAVDLPSNAQVRAVRCYSVAGQQDSPHGSLHEVPCGVDNWWSIFTPPVQEGIPSALRVSSEFQNRSSTRDRDCRLEVDWTQ